MKKVLFIANVVQTHILVFHVPYLKWFKEHGYEVHVCAANDFPEGMRVNIPYCDKYHDISFSRTPISKDTWKSSKELKRILTQESFDIIHTHTPIASVLSRLIQKNIDNKRTKVLYTAHGYHFFKGSSIKNWLLYYPIEKYLSKYTDGLILINTEDYKISKEKFHAKNTFLVDGVGINSSKFIPQTETNKRRLRDEYKIDQDAYVLFFAGELIDRKNQEVLIHAVKSLKSSIPKIQLLLAGKGVSKEKYERLVQELKLENHIKLLGYRKDVNLLMQLSDVCISSSKQEGLPVNIMEAMGTGLPIIASDCRGNRDLVHSGRNGFLVGIDDELGYINAIKRVYSEPELVKEFRRNNLTDVRKYDIENVLKEMEKIYNMFS